MKIIDRTIICSFLINLILWCMVICGIIIIADLLTHYDDFFNKSAEVNPVISIASFYGHACLKMSDSFLVFIILISSLNIVINMLRRSEVIALMAMGVSPVRIILPLLVTALFLSFGTCWLRESFIPRRIVKISGPKEYFTKKIDSVEVHRTDDVRTRVQISGESIPVNLTRIIRPVFTLPSLFGSDPIIIRGSEAVYTPQKGERPDGYIIKHVENSTELFAQGAIEINGRRHNSADETDTADSEPKETESSVSDSENFLVYTSRELPELESDSCFVVSGVPLDYLAVGDENWKVFTSTASLINAYKNASLSYRPSDLLIQIHSRIMKPISDFFPILIALPILFVYKDGNVYKRGAFAGLTAALYVGFTFAVSVIFRTAPPSLKAWLPILIFLPLVTLLFRELKDC